MSIDYHNHVSKLEADLQQSADNANVVAMERKKQQDQKGRSSGSSHETNMWGAVPFTQIL